METELDAWWQENKARLASEHEIWLASLRQKKSLICKDSVNRFFHSYSLQRVWLIKRAKAPRESDVNKLWKEVRRLRKKVEEKQ